MGEGGGDKRPCACVASPCAEAENPETGSDSTGSHEVAARLLCINQRRECGKTRAHTGWEPNRATNEAGGLGQSWRFPSASGLQRLVLPTVFFYIHINIHTYANTYTYIFGRISLVCYGGIVVSETVTEPPGASSTSRAARLRPSSAASIRSFFGPTRFVCFRSSPGPAFSSRSRSLYITGRRPTPHSA